MRIVLLMPFMMAGRITKSVFILEWLPFTARESMQVTIHQMTISKELLSQRFAMQRYPRSFIGLIRNHSDPSLYDRNIDYYDTRLAKLLDDSQMDNHLKAEYLLGLRK